MLNYQRVPLFFEKGWKRCSSKLWKLLGGNCCRNVGLPKGWLTRDDQPHGSIRFDLHRRNHWVLPFDADDHEHQNVLEWPSNPIISIIDLADGSTHILCTPPSTDFGPLCGSRVPTAAEARWSPWPGLLRSEWSPNLAMATDGIFFWRAKNDS